jgi:release factor glutamine methyltransferase
LSDWKLKTLLAVLRLAEDYLRDHGIQDARLSAEHLLTGILGVDRLGLYLNFDRPLSEDELNAFRGLLRRRAAHEPLQYILGRTAFRHLTVEVGPGVLIPRPETEFLVELVLERLEKVSQSAPEIGRNPLRVLDLCTGSGVIGLSLAAERPGLWCLLADSSTDALGWARKNFLRHDTVWLSPVRFCAADLAEAFARCPCFDIVVSNPPYVSPEEMKHLPEEIVRYEPAAALNGDGADGAGVIARLVESCAAVMRPGALLAFEIGETQREPVGRIFETRDRAFTRPEFHRDLAGKDRFVTAYRI